MTSAMAEDVYTVSQQPLPCICTLLTALLWSPFSDESQNYADLVCCSATTATSSSGLLAECLPDSFLHWQAKCITRQSQQHVACYTGQSGHAPESLSLTDPSAAVTPALINPETEHPLRQLQPDSTQQKRTAKAVQPTLPLGAYPSPKPLRSPRGWLWSRPSSLMAVTHSWWTSCWTPNPARYGTSGINRSVLNPESCCNAGYLHVTLHLCGTLQCTFCLMVYLLQPGLKLLHLFCLKEVLFVSVQGSLCMKATYAATPFVTASCCSSGHTTWQLVLSHGL